MYCTICVWYAGFIVWRKSEAVRSGVGVVKNLEPGVILAERKSCLFSPVRDKRDHPNNCVRLRTGLFISSDCLWLFRKHTHTGTPIRAFLRRCALWYNALPSGRPFAYGCFLLVLPFWMPPFTWPLFDSLWAKKRFRNFHKFHFLSKIGWNRIRMLFFSPSIWNDTRYFYWSAGKFMIK